MTTPSLTLDWIVLEGTAETPTLELASVSTGWLLRARTWDPVAGGGFRVTSIALEFVPRWTP